MRNLELEGKLLERACLALEREMREFAFEESIHTLEEAGSAGGEDRLKDLRDKMSRTYMWPEPEPWQEFARDLQGVQKEVQELPDVPSKVRGQVREEERLVSTAVWLADDFAKKHKEAKASTQIQLEALARQADWLRIFTEMWTIYQVAWEQRHKEEAWDPEIEEGLTLQSIRAGDRVVRNLYEVVQEQELDLIMPHQLLIVVPFGSGLYALGSDTPTPYVIGPYWGHRQVWTWLGYAHEVGHHVYKNINGLSDELKVNVAMELRNRGIGHDVQRIWFNWLEEVFADIVGLSQIGPAFAQTQQLMLPYLPRPVARPEVSNRLLLATDETHPIPYLRVFLAIRALEKLGIPEDDIQPLREKRDTLFSGADTSKVYALVQGRYVELPTADMKEVADIVLDVILDADLYALAKTSSPAKPRKLRDVFYESLDEEKVKRAQQAISEASSGEFDMRHLLAAMQKRLEELLAKPPLEGVVEEGVIDRDAALDKAIDDLSRRVINAITKAYQEPMLPPLSLS